MIRFFNLNGTRSITEWASVCTTPGYMKNNKSNLVSKRFCSSHDHSPLYSGLSGDRTRCLTTEDESVLQTKIKSTRSFKGTAVLPYSLRSCSISSSMVNELAVL